jgi:leader peptidase (prepilin peptidase)/N-methyltransferase
MILGFAIYVFVLGCIIGSFLNVCIYRIPLGENLAYPPSHCPNCGHKIRWYENIPILSYVFLLRGKCRKCKTKISIQYPLVEFLTGVVYTLVFLKYGVSFRTLIFFMFFSLLIVLSGIDLKKYYIPDRLSLSLIFLGLVLSFFNGVGLERSFLGASTYAFPFILIYGFGDSFMKKEVMGFGDVKLAAGIGSFLGYMNFYILHMFFTTAFVLGAGISLMLIGLKIKKREDMVPFGPFLSAASLLVVLVFY